MVTTTSVFCDVRTTTKRPIKNHELVTEETDRVMLSDSIDPISFQNFFWSTRITVHSSLDDRILEWKDRRVEDTDSTENQDRAEVVLNTKEVSLGAAVIWFTHYAHITHRKEDVMK